MATGGHGGSQLASRVTLGRMLRRLREEEAGRTVATVAKHLGCSDSMLSRIETGQRVCSQAHFDKLVALYRVPDEERVELSAYLRSARERNAWWSQYSEVLSAGYAQFLGYEEAASASFEYQVVLLPGLAQTEAYAREVIRVGFASLGPDQIDGLVEVRAERQRRRLVNTNHPIECRWVITQAALEFTVGGPDVHREQLDHLLGLSERDHIDLRVIPFDRGAAGTQTGAFTVLGFEDRDILPDVAFCEGVDGNRFYDDPRNLRRLRRLYGSIEDSALDPDASRAVIKAIKSKDD